jgi:hypothetical protein
MNIGDSIPKDVLKKIADIVVRPGDTFRIKMDQSNGIVPKKGDTSRNKFFVVLGQDGQGNIYGGVIINSNINKNLSYEQTLLLMPLKSSEYSFLEHDSFVDCASLKTVKKEEFASWQYKGRIKDDDVELIVGTISESQYETKAKLKMFGII